MRRYASVIMLIFLSFSARSQMIVTNEIDATVDSSSYDTSPYAGQWLGYFATYFINMHPEWTNSITSVSRSGASWENQYEEQQEAFCLALWCYASSNKVTAHDFMLANDNSAYVSNDVIHWGTNLFNAPPLFWNGTAITNEGISVGVTHYALGANINDVIGGDSGAVVRNSGATNLNGIYGVPLVDGWHDQFNNGFSTGLTDVTGANWFYALGHLTQKASLSQMIAAVRGLGLETNVGSITFSYSSGTVASSNKFAAININAGNSRFSCTIKADRMPPSWDILPSVSNNVATTLWVDMPVYGSVFQWTIAVTGLPTGTYNAYLDGVLIDTATGVQWAAGRNMATNGIASNPWNVQRTKVLYDVRDKYGVGHTDGLPTHGAGENGILGPDLINYRSQAAGQFPTKTGAALVNYLAPYAAGLRLYDVVSHNDAQQVPHTLVIMPPPTFIPAPFGR